MYVFLRKYVGSVNSSHKTTKHQNAIISTARWNFCTFHLSDAAKFGGKVSGWFEWLRWFYWFCLQELQT